MNSCNASVEPMLAEAKGCSDDTQRMRFHVANSKLLKLVSDNGAKQSTKSAPEAIISFGSSVTVSDTVIFGNSSPLVASFSDRSHEVLSKSPGKVWPKRCP